MPLRLGPWCCLHSRTTWGRVLLQTPMIRSDLTVECDLAGPKMGTGSQEYSGKVFQMTFIQPEELDRYCYTVLIFILHSSFYVFAKLEQSTRFFGFLPPRTSQHLSQVKSETVLLVLIQSFLSYQGVKCCCFMLWVRHCFFQGCPL